MATLGYISVVTTAEQGAQKKAAEEAGKPAHWVNKNGTEFTNPWPSFRKHVFKDTVYVSARSVYTIRMCSNKLANVLQLLPHMMTHSPTIPKDLKSRLPVIKPTWGLSESGTLMAETREKIKATWLGHACFLVELPVRSSDVGRGARILFDPVFSDRCSPSQIIGPKRFTGDCTLLNQSHLIICQLEINYHRASVQNFRNT